MSTYSRGVENDRDSLRGIGMLLSPVSMALVSASMLRAFRVLVTLAIEPKPWRKPLQRCLQLLRRRPL